MITNKNFCLFLPLCRWPKDKFGIKFSEFSFWSESTKSLKLLNSLHPLVLDKHPEKLIKKIKTFFLEQGKMSLKKEIK